ncbi:hypothetical protein MCAMS1_02388 [biofilm metagenome]
MKLIKLLLLMAFLASSNLVVAEIDNTQKNSPTTGTIESKPLKYGAGSKYEGYSIDGFATASKLAAQRSHTVAGKDERNFAVFTGITVVLIIYFFTQFNFFDR